MSVIETMPVKSVGQFIRLLSQSLILLKQWLPGTCQTPREQRPKAHVNSKRDRLKRTAKELLKHTAEVLGLVLS